MSLGIIDQQNYLKKYLGKKKTHKSKEKKKKKSSSQGHGFRVVDDSLDIKDIPYGTQDDDCAPTVAEITYEDEKLKLIDEFQSNKKKWKGINSGELGEDKIEIKTDDSGLISFESRREENSRASSVTESLKSSNSFATKFSDSVNCGSEASPPRRRRHDSDSPSSRGKTNFQDVSPQRRKRHDSDTPHRLIRENADKSPHRRKRYDSDTSPPRGQRHDSHTSQPRHKKNDSNTSPPHRKRHDSDASPPHRKRHDSDASPPHRKRDDSHTSPPRRKRHDSDASPPPRRKRDDSDVSPPHRKRHDSNTSLPRRKRHDSDTSPPRRKKHDSDTSPPRRKRHDSDASPPRRKRHDSDTSPPRRKRHDSDTSPPRRKRHDSDASPPRKKRHDSDASPPRRKRHDSDASPPRRKRHDSDASPPRRKRHDSDVSLPRRKLGNPALPPPPIEKAVSKQNNRSHGFVEATSLSSFSNKKGNEHLKASSFRKIKGKIPKELTEEEKAIAEKMKEKYQKWNKGIVQDQKRKENLEYTVREMGKSFARSADDEDMNRSLKDVLRRDDPMLEYVANKRANESDQPVKPRYKGGFPPNRFGIVPGYRWDGVDRSSGYEKEWFTKQSSQRAIEEESYKWSIEDM